MDRRKLRKSYDTPYHAHFLTFSTYQRQQFFLLPGVAEVFLGYLDVARRSLNFDLWAYVVMPEHTHILVRPREGSYSMPAILKAIKTPSAREVFRLNPSLRESCLVEGRHGEEEFRFWQAGGGYDRNIFTAREAWEKIRYLHYNPVKRGLCSRSSEWVMSSAGAYLDEPQPTPIPVDICLWRND